MGAVRHTTLRRAAVGTAVVCGLAVAHAASATPDSVGQYHLDTGTAVVRGADGLTYQVAFELRATTGQPSQTSVLAVKYKACKRDGRCGFTYTYQLSLTSRQVSFPDANVASVTANLLGRPLRLHWSATPATTGGASVAVNAEIPDTIAVQDPSSGGSADFTAEFFGVHCGGPGTVVNDYGAFTAPSAGSSSGPTRLPAGFVAKRGHKAGCQSSA